MMPEVGGYLGCQGSDYPFDRELPMSAENNYPRGRGVTQFSKGVVAHSARSYPYQSGVIIHRVGELPNLWIVIYVSRE